MEPDATMILYAEAANARPLNVFPSGSPWPRRNVRASRYCSVVPERLGWPCQHFCEEVQRIFSQGNADLLPP
jgi:hypothetical protein